jgi:glutamyl-tRNA reductase
MAELALECLVHEGVRAVIVANRTHQRATDLAARHGARAIHYDECWASLGEVDVLLCSTAAPHPIVTAEHVRAAAAARRDEPLCILDIAMPRDVEPDVRRLANVFLYDLDDLHAVISANLERRRSELPVAEQIIASEVRRYCTWLSALAAVPVVRLFRTQMDEIRQRELAHAMRRLPHLSREERTEVEEFSRALMNKFLHQPTVRLREAAAMGDAESMVDTARYLFGLEGGAAPDVVPDTDTAPMLVEDAVTELAREPQREGAS